MYVYSADFPGPMRDVVRAVTGGECVFFQGAGGNVLPKFAFTDDRGRGATAWGRGSASRRSTPSPTGFSRPVERRDGATRAR